MSKGRRRHISDASRRVLSSFFFKFGTQVCLGVLSINSFFVLSYLIEYAHNSMISDFSIFGIHRVIFFKLEPSNFVHFEI